MADLYYLAHLVMVKNDLNRKRRRFYALMNPGRESVLVHPADEKHYDPKWDFQNRGYSFTHLPKPMHKAYSKMEAERGYRKAQRDMKAMTKHMRQVREELGAQFVWGSGGQIMGIKHEGKAYWDCWAFNIEANRFTRQTGLRTLADHYRFEQKVLV